MKKKVKVFERRIYNSGSAGKFSAVAMAEKLLAVLGSADTALVETTVGGLSGANAQFRTQIWHGTKNDIRPSFTNGGLQIGADAVISAIGVTNVPVSPPFHDLLELVAGGDSTDGNPSWVEAEVSVTLGYA